MCRLSADITDAGSYGLLVVLNFSFVNSGLVVKFYNYFNDSRPQNNQFVIENMSVSGTNLIVIDANENTKLANSPTIDT